LGIGVDLPKVGGRLRIGGGYFHEPAWLDGHEFHLATVFKYIPGQNSNDALVAKLTHLFRVNLLLEAPWFWKFVTSVKNGRRAV
jgi:hypothetical protein